MITGMKLFTRNRLILGKGLAASILLHGLVVGSLFYVQQNNSYSEQIAVAELPRQYIVVSTQQRGPEKIQPDEPVPVTLPPIADASDADSLEDSLAAPPQAEPESINTEVVAEAPITNPGPGIITNEENTLSVTSGPAPDEGTVTPYSIRSSVTAYVQRQQGTYSEAWVGACIIYQKEHGVQDCPQQQAQDYSGNKDERVLVGRLLDSVTRTQRSTRMTEQFLAENKQLKKLMKGADPVLAELARTRHAFNNEYVAYLNGNFDFKAWAFVQVANSGNGNLPYISSFMQAICKPSPCVWNYTGFKVIKPQAPATNPEADFKISTIVLGSNK